MPRIVRSHANDTPPPMDPLCGRGTGVNPYGDNYPFVRKNDVARGILAELRLTHEVRDAVLPLRVSWMYGFDGGFHSLPGPRDETFAGTVNGYTVVPTNDAEILIVDAAGAIIFDSTLAAYYKATDLDYCRREHLWITDKAALKVVQHRDFRIPEDAWAMPKDVRPPDGELDARTTIVIPKRVRSLSAFTKTEYTYDCGSTWTWPAFYSQFLTPAELAALPNPYSGFPCTGESLAKEEVAGLVELHAGYNIVLDPKVVERGARKIVQVTISAKPGSGAGRVPGCEEPKQVALSFNGIQPDKHGNLSIAAHGCTWVRQPSPLTQKFPRKSSPRTATLLIDDDCDPCCKCEDFMRVQRGVLRTWRKARETAHRAEFVRDEFRETVTRWLEDRDCRNKKLVKANFISHHKQYIEVAASVTNNTDHCIKDVTITFDILEGPDMVVSKYTTYATNERGLMASTILDGDESPYSYKWDAIEAMSAAKIKFQLKTADPVAIGTEAVIKITADIEDNDPVIINLPQNFTRHVIWS